MVRHQLLRATASVLLLLLMPAAALANPLCGNGVIDADEECDDGNLYPLDGCNGSCRYELVQRFAELALSGGIGPVACTPNSNAFGQAFSSFGRDAINQALAAGIADGSFDQLLVFDGLDDPLGVDDPALGLGMIPARLDPESPSSGLDSWHLGAAALFDRDGSPVGAMPGAVAARDLAVGPSDLTLTSPFGDFVIREGRLLGLVDSFTSQPAPPPDLMRPGFVTFENLDGLDAQHGLCGNISVGSLAIVPIPTEFAIGGTLQCSDSCTDSRSYQACAPGDPVGPTCNSFLDLLVSGCATPDIICLPFVNPSQPDVGAGGGSPTVLIPDPVTGKVAVTEPDDAYSTVYRFTAQRVHLTNYLSALFLDWFESGDVSAWSHTLP